MKALNVSVAEAARNLTIEVKITGLRMFRARMWLAALICKLAALVAGCKSDVSVEITNES